MSDNYILCPAHGRRRIKDIVGTPDGGNYEADCGHSFSFAEAKQILIQTPKLLFLDDRSKRIHAALKKFTGFDVTIVPSVKEFLRKISFEDFDEVYLDHDLNGEEFQDPDSSESGMEIVRYLEKTGGWPPNKKKPIFKIHSINIFAAHLMVDRLNALDIYARYEPFEY